MCEPQFSGVFLNTLLGKTNQIDDLVYLDEQFYKSLMNMKTFVQNGGDISTAGLTFEVVLFLLELYVESCCVSNTSFLFSYCLVYLLKG